MEPKRTRQRERGERERERDCVCVCVYLRFRALEAKSACVRVREGLWIGKKSEGEMKKIGVLIRFCVTCAASSVASFSITR